MNEAALARRRAYMRAYRRRARLGGTKAWVRMMSQPSRQRQMMERTLAFLRLPTPDRPEPDDALPSLPVRHVPHRAAERSHENSMDHDLDITRPQRLARIPIYAARLQTIKKRAKRRRVRYESGWTFYGLVVPRSATIFHD